MTQFEDSEDVAAIKALITAFFDAVNDADTEALGALFFEQANLVIVRQDPPLPPASSQYDASSRADSKEKLPGQSEETLSVVIRTSIEKFIHMLEEGKKRREGKPGPVLHEEPDLDTTEVKVDKLFGMAWSPFRVTFDGVLHHYGTMVYTLGKTPNKEGQKMWKVEGLTQNYRRTPGWESQPDFAM